tara:strand:+ start:1112 stop:1984 length:873 start_codon:yes stop_codon:yes gene_type:complete
MADLLNIEIAQLCIQFSGQAALLETMQERYAGFVVQHPPRVTMELREVAPLDPSFRESEFLPEIRYLDDGFEIDHAPYFLIRYNSQTQGGVLNYSLAPRNLPFGEVSPPEQYSPLPFGLRRAIGSLFITLLAQDGAPSLHASCVEHNDKAVVAPGDSGTGKTTFFYMFPTENRLNDEFVTLRLCEDESVNIFSTPFSASWDAPRESRQSKLKYLLQLIQAPNEEWGDLKSSDVLRILTHNSVLPVGADAECALNFQSYTELVGRIKGKSLRFSLNAKSVVDKVVELLSSD